MPKIKQLVNSLLSTYPPDDFSSQQINSNRYYFDNPSFSWADGAITQAIIRSAKPKRIIEVGAGFSTCLICDVNKNYFNSSIKVTSIDPFILDYSRFRELIESNELEFIQKPVQEIDLELFDALDTGDILFIDSSHVSKAGSDVNWLFFRVLPRIKQGVLIHIHDVFFPFDYPADWLAGGRSWNEVYLLRAFLQFNDSFQMFLMNNAVGINSRLLSEQARIIFEKNSGGSVWLFRARDNDQSEKDSRYVNYLQLLNFTD